MWFKNDWPWSQTKEDFPSCCTWLEWCHSLSCQSVLMQKLWENSTRKKPFTLYGFNSSFFLLQNIMKKLGNLNYTLQMISDELHISKTQLCKYLDSFIAIPPRRLPECLGIDELYRKTLSKRNSSYLCILVDNEKNTFMTYWIPETNIIFPCIFQRFHVTSGWT